jgi:hypothetical protein
MSLDTKTNIIIFIRSATVLRNYVETDAFAKLKDRYNIYYLLPEKEKIRNYPHFDEILIKDYRLFSGSNVVTHNFDINKYGLRHVLKCLFIFRAAKHSVTYASIFYSESGKIKNKKHLVYRLMSIRLFYNFFISLFENLIPLDRILFKKIKEIFPEFIVIPISSPGNEENELIKISKKLKIKSVVIPQSWDNITSKMFLYQTPSFILERGEQNAEFARKIFELSQGRISIIGVPQYEMFFNYQKKEDLKKRKLNYLTKNRIPLDKDLILFGGSLRPFDETSFLEELEMAIERKELPNLHIIYRPHPERDRRIKEKSFFDCTFKHITFDEELKFAYLNFKSNYLPNLDNYLDLYNSIDAIICPPTSIMVETALFGKAVLGLVCDDGYHHGWTSAQMIIDREHFKIWKDFKWFVRCNDKKDFIYDCKRLLKIVKTPGISEEIKKDLSFIVYSDERSCSQIILDALKSWE